MNDAREIKVRWARKGEHRSDPYPGGTFAYLDRLRAKPLHVRKRIAFISTALISLFIGTIWWNSFNAAGVLAEENIAASASSPWAVVFDTIGRAKESTVAAYTDTIGQIRSLGAEYADDEAVTGPIDSGQEGGVQEDLGGAVVEGDIVYPEDLRGNVQESGVRTRPQTLDEMTAHTTDD